MKPNKPQSLGRASALDILRPMMLVMLLLWLVSQVGQLLAGRFDSWDWGLSMGFYPSSYALRHQPWGIISYPWWHRDLLSLGLNILCLYGLARLYDERRRQALPFLLTFVWGSLWGAVLYALVAWLGGMLGFIQIFPLYGASAGVCALAFRLAMSAPRRQLRFMGIRLNFLLLVLLIYSLVTLLSGENLGGILAHLGGACYGIILALWGEDSSGRGQGKARGNAPTPPTRSEQEWLGDRLRESGYKSLSPEEQEKL